MKIAVLFINYGPYHVARVNALGVLSKDYHEVIAIEIAAKEETYAWKRPPIPATFSLITLFPDSKVYEDIPTLKEMAATWKCLNRVHPDVVAICGYRNPAMLSALLWSNINRKIAIFMNDSKKDDFFRNIAKETIKKVLLKGFDSALVGGILQREYTRELGIPDERIFECYPAIDNEFFRVGAARARSQAAKLRQELGLPDNYFLCVSRFASKKNLFGLLQAYELYRKNISTPWNLVIVGSGPIETELKKYASEIEGVSFPGFKQFYDLPEYYGLAKCFVIPSSHSEQWGLVVNEAMASGLPVLVSRACGCCPNLVKEGGNGFSFDPLNLEELSRLMGRMSSDEVDLEAMGRASLEIIKGWAPEAFAAGFLNAIAVGKASRKQQRIL
jgi:1,2-diacylglycerol 3-alpha-glucosyltransferase